MTFRKIISLGIAMSFLILFITGILSFFSEYTRTVATIHTVFGLIFGVAAFFHIANNFLPLKKYAKGVFFPIILFVIILFFSSAYYQISPVNSLMNYGAKQKAKAGTSTQSSAYEVIEMNLENDIQLSLDLLRSEHFWHPQVAIWTEDSLGNFQNTLFVTKATAKGIFSGGRTKDNFKTFDSEPTNSDETDYRRVDALPVWSHKRGVQYPDGMFTPTADQPLPDAITGATPLDNFKLDTSIDSLSKFVLKFEINVAFDDNENYSEFDFPDDETFHNGTGQLGQPSLIFEAKIDMSDGKNYYLMELFGHGHRSGGNGEIYKELESLTTALNIVERIVVAAKIKE